MLAVTNITMVPKKVTVTWIGMRDPHEEVAELVDLVVFEEVGYT